MQAAQGVGEKSVVIHGKFRPLLAAFWRSDIAPDPFLEGFHAACRADIWPQISGLCSILMAF